MKIMNTKVKIGDILESNATTLVNTVNCVGVMGKGIAQDFKKKFPDMYKDYKNACDLGKVEPGVPYIYKDILGTSIVNFPTKLHWRSPSKLNDIVKGLGIFLDKYKNWGIKSVAFPPLGCGNGGLEWNVVGPIMFQNLSSIDIPVEIYAPYGTPQKQLTSEFLNKNVSVQPNVIGNKNARMNPVWITILEVLNVLSKQYYSKPVGRTIYQKICYILTEQGVDTGFIFKQGSYGPFSNEAKKALSVFANMNLIGEYQIGQMNALKIESEYHKIAEKYHNEITKHKTKILKTADLFSRIKDTKQAEEVTTVLFASRRLKEMKETNNISENDLYYYILNWKKTWDQPEKKKALGTTMRNLEMLNWLKLNYSETLPMADQH